MSKKAVKPSSKPSPEALEAAEKAREAKLPAGDSAPSAIRSLMNEVRGKGRPSK
jgi:hypothetical protein